MVNIFATLVLCLGFLTSRAVAQDAATEVVAPVDMATEIAAPVEDASTDVAVIQDEVSGGVVVTADAGSDTEAATVPTTDAEAIQVVVSMVDAVKTGQYPLAAGLLLTLLVYLVNRFTTKITFSAKVVPWVTFGLGFAGSAGTALVMGHPIPDSVVEGILAGVLAIGGWEMLLKHNVSESTPTDPTV